MIKQFRHLPHSLQVLFMTFVAGPLAFVAAWLINIPTIVGLPGWYLGVTVFVYGVGPWLVAFFLIRRQRAFLYTFGGWGLVLIAMAFAAPSGLPLAFVVVHTTFAMTMVTTALVLINRDLLLPLMFPARRGWRLAPRVPTNQRAKLFIPRLQREATVMMEDCSLTGMAAYGPEDALEEALEATIRGEPIVLNCVIARQNFDVTMFCMWQSRAAGIVRIGLKAQDPSAMEALFEALKPVQAERSIPRRLRETWGGPTLRRALNYVLAVALMSLMLLPPLFLDNGPGHRAFVALRTLFTDKAETTTH